MNSWNNIAPFWSLKNLIAVNPLKGFEDLHFKDALKEAEIYFQQTDLPEGMCNINRESIKWLQAFFDEGQAKIKMPNKERFLKSILALLVFDDRIHNNELKKIEWLKKLPKDPLDIITKCLISLGIQEGERELFSTLMLTTLPGWASYIKYQTEWNGNGNVTQNEYLAFRLIVTYLMWPRAAELLTWHKQATEQADSQKTYESICKKEKAYQEKLLKQLQTPHTDSTETPDAQFIFCIDVRSEPFRRKLESVGNYETFGYAGFFGIPVSIKNSLTQDSYAACPVLLYPEETVLTEANSKTKKQYKRLQLVKRMYQSVKYTFTLPLTLVEAIGIFSGLSIFFKTFFPRLAKKLKQIFATNTNNALPLIDSLSLDKQIAYAYQGLTMMGLTNNFAETVVICGHVSTTENNIYQSSLDCGACAGHSGAVNAQILAAILNNIKVRKELSKNDIHIPERTTFIAAEHNTTTDELTLLNTKIPELEKNLLKLKNISGKLKSNDWAETRPEWGLARNASFIIGPREYTKHLDLEGRAFLHSYDYTQDPTKSSLRKILTAPVIVGQWINAQYLFSTLDNVAFGGGSKVTKNITGKIGIMQGNASDLMTGLSLQSVYETDTQNYHEPLRLTVCVYAPQEYIDEIINTESALKKLVDNEWIFIKSLG